MTGWDDLRAELDAWTADGREATIWWRDDDVVEPTAALDRLLALAAADDIPLTLAVVPARAGPALAARLAANGRPDPRRTLVQHGFAHGNHAPSGEKKVELGAHRPAAAVLEALVRGGARMSALFGASWQPVLVPPWNRIAPEIVAQLGRLGFTGLSTYGPRRAVHAAPGVLQVNGHVDIMRWAAPRGFLGTSEALALLIDHLRARRTGTADAAEPTGLLTHHLAHDEACWDFLARLAAALAAHAAVRFLAGAEVFRPPSTREP